MAQRLSGGNVAIALLANTLATAGVLVCLIAALGPISGAHFNPAVSLADALGGGLRWRELPAYVGSQLAGAVVGVATADSMFGLAPFSLATRVRSGPGQWLGEFVAAFGLMIVIWGCVRFRVAAPSVCRRSLHWGGVLVYFLYVVRESSGDDRAVVVGHIYGRSAPPTSRHS